MTKTMRSICACLTKTPAVKARWLDSFYMGMSPEEIDEFCSTASVLRENNISGLIDFLRNRRDMRGFDMAIFESDQAACGRPLNITAWVEDRRIPQLNREIAEYKAVIENKNALLKIAERNRKKMENE